MNDRGYTIWFTGLSASGKSTISHALEIRLSEYSDKHLYVIDGDYMRRTINKDLGYTPRQRNIASERIAYVAKILNDNGVVCLVSNISQNDEIRKRVREITKDFILVFVDTPLDVCSQRCYKGHYAKAFNGELDNMVGIHHEYERPDDAEITIDTCSTSPDKAVEDILDYLEKVGKISR
jgi:adenylyl-sulfate kinase